MKHKIPFFISLFFSLAGFVSLFIPNILAAQIFLTLSVPFSIVAFKLDGGRKTAFTHYLPGFGLAFIYYTSFNAPLLALSMALAMFYNSFMEIYFESAAYSAKYIRLIVAPIVIGLYIASNIMTPGGWQTWTFPGVVILFTTLLALAITADIIDLTKSSANYIAMGSNCPEFNLPNEDGKLVSAKDFLGSPLLIIFVRGDWCPGCHIMLRSYQRNRAKFLERDVQMLSIGPDPFGINKEMVEKLGLNYHILSDETQDVAKQFCVELQKARKGTTNKEFIPLPASFLVDKSGVVRYSSRPEIAGEFLYPDKIFEVLDTLN